ncbi:MAG: glycosyltransferase family 39 protein [Desulfobacterales bacterium]|jgi:4-amino-4-deoxy-L-arabinose transferase-like glycosyltransferase
MGKPLLWGTIVTLGLVLIIGLYLRSGSWIGTTVRRPIQSDAAEYFFYAYNLRFYQTYSRQINLATDSNDKPVPDAIRPPGYPIVLSFLIDAPPDRKLIKKIQLAQMLISTLTLSVAFFFFRSYLSLLTSGIAAMLVAISPHLIMFNSYILSETSFAFILVLLGFLVTRYINHPSPRFSVVLGAITGIGVLTRPSLQFFPPVLALMVLIHFGRKEGLKRSVLILLGFVLLLSPWLIRNAFTIGKLSDSSLIINFLHHGMYPDLKYQQDPVSYGRPYYFDPKTEETNANVYSVLVEIKDRFHTDPLKHLKWYLLKKPVVFWSWDMVQGHGDIYVYYVSQTPYSENMIFRWTHKIMKWLHGPLVVFSLLGSLVVWVIPGSIAPGRNAIFIARFGAALLLYYTFLHMIGAPFPRYSVPLRPFQYGMALFCLHSIYRAVRNTRVKVDRFR